jgi:hydrogenase maturation factor
MRLPKGKLGWSDLERLVFRHLPRVSDTRLLPLDFSKAALTGEFIAASDPVIGVPLHHYGFFAVHYSATDVAMAKAIPHYLTLGIYYPPDTPESWLESNMQLLGKEARRLDIQILGGHTGGYDGLTIPLISTTCLGVVPKDLSKPRSVSVKDVLVVVGSVGWETFWFLANVQPDKVEQVVTIKQRKEIADNLEPFALIPLLQSLPLQEMPLLHDLAEGGLATGLLEVARTTGLGISINYDVIPWDQTVLTLFQQLQWDPLFCSSFGSFLFASSYEVAQGIIKSVQKRGFAAAIIGEFRKERDVVITRKGTASPLNQGSDPYKQLTDQLGGPSS